jgi:hypothetical protein
MADNKVSLNAAVAQPDDVASPFQPASPPDSGEESDFSSMYSQEPERELTASFTQDQEATVTELPPIAHAPGVSIASDPTYPADVRENPATDHRRYAIDAGNFTALSNTAEGDRSGLARSFEPSHRRNNLAKGISFAVPLSDRPDDSAAPAEPTSSHTHNLSGGSEVEGLHQISSHQSHDSMGTTAVNTIRPPSVASDDWDVEVDDWARLRAILDKAGPGVTIKINLTVMYETQPLPHASSERDDVAGQDTAAEVQETGFFDLLGGKVAAWYTQRIPSAVRFHLEPWIALIMWGSTVLVTLCGIIKVLLIVAIAIYSVYIGIIGVAYILDDVVPGLVSYHGSTTPFPDVAALFRLLF